MFTMIATLFHFILLAFQTHKDVALPVKINAGLLIN